MSDEGDMPTLMDNDDGESDMMQTSSSDPSNDDLECVSAGTSSKSASGQDSTGDHAPKDKKVVTKGKKRGREERLR